MITAPDCVPGPDVDQRRLTVQAGDRNLGAERGRGHRHRDRAVQVGPVAGEDVVGQFVDLDVQVAGRAAAGADLALAGEPDAHAVLDPGRHVDRDRALRPDPAVATAIGAGVGDLLAGAGARRARPGGHDLTEQRALDGLDLTRAVADVTGARLGAGRATVATAGRAYDGGVDRDVAVHAQGRLGHAQIEAQQRVRAGADPAPRAAPAAVGTAPEEHVEDVAQAAAEAPAERAAARALTATTERIATEVDHATLLRVRQHLVGRRHLFETVLIGRIGVDVGVQFASELAVGPLDLLAGGVASYAEQAVVVADRFGQRTHFSHSFFGPAETPTARPSVRNRARHPATRSGLARPWRWALASAPAQVGGRRSAVGGRRSAVGVSRSSLRRSGRPRRPGPW